MAQNISVDTVWRHWQRLRAMSPLVHCMTNDVVANWTANVLLAAGAAPAMVVDDSEAEVFAAMASALLINVGTLRVPQAQAMTKAVAAARQAGKPWVVDPVAVGVLPYRTAFCHILLEETPTVVRGNPSEILALAGDAAQGRGVDSTKGSDAALAAAQRLALEWDTVVAVTGATDYITDGVQTLRVVQGHPLLQRVTGTGCALSALVAACIAGTTGKAETLAAAATACAVFAVAGEVAAQKTLDRNEGPGSFAVHLLDALDAVDEALLRKRMAS